MPSTPFISYAQNREDVVLNRALSHLPSGRYVDVGANDPQVDSISRAFYEKGWRGVTVEPMHTLAEKHRAQRPGDVLIEGVVTDHGGDTLVLHEVTGTGLSTLVESIGDRHAEDGLDVSRVEVRSSTLNDVLAAVGWQQQDIHFMTVDTEGTEESVLRGIDLSVWRPWILVIEATEPRSAKPSFQSWEPIVTDAGYRFVLFDGLSRFYVAAEHFDELAPKLSAPANPLDNFTTYIELRNDAEITRLITATVQLEEARAGLAGERQHLLDERASLAAQIATLERLQNDNINAIVRWRSAAFGSWSHAATNNTSVVVVEDTSEELVFLRNQTHAVTEELKNIRATLSWRVTRPLRMVRRLGKLVGR